jgi:hypothetical protein
MGCFVEHCYQDRDLEQELIGAGHRPALPLRPQEEPSVVELLRECAQYPERTDARSLLRSLERDGRGRRLYLVDELI